MTTSDCLRIFLFVFMASFIENQVWRLCGRNDQFPFLVSIPIVVFAAMIFIINDEKDDGSGDRTPRPRRHRH